MPFTYTYRIHFKDTDAAGVVYFANVLAICHQAYEESLLKSGINLKSFFSHSAVAIPIVHAHVDFMQPMFCGDNIIIYLSPHYLTSNKFEISYKIFATSEEIIANATTRHVCIETMTRNRKELPTEIMDWLHDWGDDEATT